MSYLNVYFPIRLFDFKLVNVQINTTIFGTFKILEPPECSQKSSPISFCTSPSAIIKRETPVSPSSYTSRPCTVVSSSDRYSTPVPTSPAFLNFACLNRLSSRCSSASSSISMSFCRRSISSPAETSTISPGSDNKLRKVAKISPMDRVDPMDGVTNQKSGPCSKDNNLNEAVELLETQSGVKSGEELGNSIVCDENQQIGSSSVIGISDKTLTVKVGYGFGKQSPHTSPIKKSPVSAISLKGETSQNGFAKNPDDLSLDDVFYSLDNVNNLKDVAETQKKVCDDDDDNVSNVCRRFLSESSISSTCSIVKCKKFQPNLGEYSKFRLKFDFCNIQVVSIKNEFYHQIFFTY